MIWIIIAAIVAFMGLIWLGYEIAKAQTDDIHRCFELRRLERELLLGETKFEGLSARDLLAIRHPMFTHVGMGGIGPYYNPSFFVLLEANEELARRRKANK